ncbi:MlaD family protein [Patulibacter defluvii]|uniref:MlaD family protein n=1 Tax=Patulibacter defluvii TaxID=3095358 RepID=UPI002A7561FB|nr:MlaD family protein [Patulibacter sp. DM4]
MNRRRTSLAGSPVLVGAATVLIALVAILLSYNANSGLPFIQTYDITARVADAKKLTTGVDVRIGGKRVGQINGIRAEATKDHRSFYAELDLKLDQTVAELPVDTTLRIRPKSVIGAKYVELVPGTSRKTIPIGGVIQEDHTSASVDLDEVTGLFDAGLRQSFRSVIKEASNGVAGRGAEFNQALAVLPDVLDEATRLLRTVSDPRTDLGGLIRGADATTQAVLPVTSDLGRLITGARVTFEALAAESPSLGLILQRTPGTLTEARRASRELTPFLRDAALLARELRPGTEQLPATIKALHGVTVHGVPVLKRAPVLGQELRKTLTTLDKNLQQPSTTASLVMLKPIAENLLPTLQTVVPSQVRCNYAGLFARNAGSVVGEGDRNGNWFRLILLLSFPQMLGKASTPESELHYNIYPDSDKGTCEIGNERYLPGRHLGPVGGAPTTNPKTSAPAGAAKGPR